MGLLLLLGLMGQDLELVRREVSDVVQACFADAGDERKNAYIEQLVGAFLSAPSSPVLAEVLEALPEAARYHALVVDRYRDVALTPDALIEAPEAGSPLSPALVESGYDVQVGYLAARTRRALRRDRGDPTRRAVTAQIDALTAAARTQLRERLPGEAAAMWIDSVVEGWKKGWLASYDLPYNAFLDAPLSPAELETVLAEMRRRAAAVAPRLLDERDFASEERRQKLGLDALANDVREAAYRASALNYREYDEWADQTRTWEARADVDRDRYLALLSSTARAKDPGSELPAFEAPRPSAEGRRQRAGADPPGGGPQGSSGRSEPTRASERSLGVWVFPSFAALALIALAWVLARRARS